MYCPQCGSKSSEHDIFCSECGFNLELVKKKSSTSEIAPPLPSQHTNNTTEEQEDHESHEKERGHVDYAEEHEVKNEKVNSEQSNEVASAQVQTETVINEDSNNASDQQYSSELHNSIESSSIESSNVDSSSIDSSSVDSSSVDSSSINSSSINSSSIESSNIDSSSIDSSNANADSSSNSSSNGQQQSQDPPLQNSVDSNTGQLDKQINNVIEGKKKILDWKIGVIIGLALIVLVGGVFIVKDKFSSMKSSTDNASESNISAKSDKADSAAGIAATNVKDDDTAQLSNVLNNIEVDDIDVSQFPLITIKLANADHEIFQKHIDRVSIVEQSLEQGMPKLSYNEAEKIEITYTALEGKHKSPGSADKRSGTIMLYDKQLDFTYEVPEPTELYVRDISYNTDQYPAISMYFSLYDHNDQKVDSLKLTDQVLQVTENGKIQMISDMSKMSDEENILSINIVVDDSASMYDKIDVVKSEVLQFLDQIPTGKQFRLGFMSFAGASEIYQYDFTDTAEHIKPIVLGLMAEGTCTALYSAIDSAIYNIAYNNEKGSKYVIVFTDGEENCSNDDYENQAFMSPQTVINNANQFGIPVYAVGVDYDNDLKEIALGTNGDYISIGTDLEQLGMFYESIFNKKKSQYVVSYNSDSSSKQPRQVGISLHNERYISNAETSVEPRLIDKYEVAKVMEHYQINWSRAMSSGNVSYLLPYVVYDLDSKNAVHKIVHDQIVDLNAAYTKGIESHYSAPIYKVTDASKQSEIWYKIQLDKYFKRSIFTHGVLSSERFRKTTYTYNVVKQGEDWLVKSIDADDNSNICYTDETYSVQKVCD